MKRLSTILITLPGIAAIAFVGYMAVRAFTADYITLPRGSWQCIEHMPARGTTVQLDPDALCVQWRKKP